MNIISGQFKLYQKRLLTFCLLSWIFALTPLQAEQMIEDNGYKIHYNAFNSSMLNPSVVSQYGIKRSTSLGVLNISVLDSSDNAMTALLLGKTKNPIAQFTNLDFKKITEGKAIYYIATFDFADKEQLNFDIMVVPDGETKKISLKFSQQFFVE